MQKNIVNAIQIHKQGAVMLTILIILIAAPIALQLLNLLISIIIALFSSDEPIKQTKENKVNENSK